MKAINNPNPNLAAIISSEDNVLKAEKPEENAAVLSDYTYILCGKDAIERYISYGLLIGSNNVLKYFETKSEKEAYLNGMQDGDRLGNCQIVDNLLHKLYIWWQAQPEHIRRIFSVYSSYDQSWTALDLRTQLNIYNFCLFKEYGFSIPEGDERSMLIEIVCELADLALECLNGKPREDLCDEGEYLPKYQEQFNRIFDDMEALIINHDYVLSFNTLTCEN